MADRLSEAPKEHLISVHQQATTDKPGAKGKLLMRVKVYSPFKTYFDGYATSISASNATGPFDILPRHHNFMTLVTECEVVVRNEKNEEHFTVSRGVMHVKGDQVILFLDV